MIVNTVEPTVVPKQTRLLEALKKGQMLTEKQITSKFSIANPRATVSDIRKKGYSIVAQRTTTKSGKTTTKYVFVG
jgi:hypothetical protein